MFRQTLWMAALTSALALLIGWAWAADEARTQREVQSQEQTLDQTQARSRSDIRRRERIYGSDLMTRHERNEYRNRMRAAKTLEAREQIREEHHERMKLRAQERGITLPEVPPVRGGMMAAGDGMAPDGAPNR